MASDLFVTSDQSPLLFLAFWLLGGLVVVLILATLAIWTIGNARLRWRKNLHRRWESIVLEYLCQEEEIEKQRLYLRLSRDLRFWERQAFGDFILEYLEELRGEDADRLRSLLRILSYDVRSIRQLGAVNPWRRALAARLLGAMKSRDAEPNLIAAIDDRNPLVSFAAASALMKIGSERSFPVIAEALTRNYEWNAGQVKELSATGGEQLAESLHHLLLNEELTMERTKVLVDLLGSFRHLAACRTLLHLLRNDPPLELRVSLLRCLGKLELQEAFPDALAGLLDPNWIVRSQAALALGRIGDETAVPDLSRALTDPEYWVRYNAALALKELGASGRSVLEGIAGTNGPTTVLAQEVLLGEDVA